MLGELHRLMATIGVAVDRHGGGWTGVRAVAARVFKLARAMGIRGLWRRVKGASRHSVPLRAPMIDVAYPEPSPVDELTLTVGVMAHVFYPDLIEEFARHLENIPRPFVLMVSVVDQDAKRQAEARFSRLERISTLHLRVVPNRGRDIAPMMLTFRDEILAVDIVCHIHTKKSLYTGSEQEQWRLYLLDSLLGSPARVGSILGLFQAMPALGMVYPESFRSVSLAAHTWLSNVPHARELGARLGLAIEPTDYLDFAAGSMFWARVEAIRPLYELGLSLSDFPEEVGQNDGTLQHALERLFAQVTRHRGMALGILPATGEFMPQSEGARNWHTYFGRRVGDQILERSIDAEIVSFDIFDTLVQRAFLTPAGARAYFGHCALDRLGMDDLAALRERAEARARARAATDVALPAIYAELAQFPQAEGVDIAALQDLELALERRQLRPRAAVCEAALRVARDGKRVIALSDMYLTESMIRTVLPKETNDAIPTVLVSCETGWRKDTGDAWRELPTHLGTPPESWLHVGDNEHSDKQLPHDLGFVPPVHVLRPKALFDVVPALRPLRPTREQAAQWPNDLWLGLLANRFCDLADRKPQAFSDGVTVEDPSMIGYTVFGPLVLDYLLWTFRQARNDGAEKILFLSREGYLLHKAFELLRSRIPAAAGIEAVYLLASRRAVGTATLRDPEHIRGLLAGSFNGTLHQLLQARMGDRIAQVVADILGQRSVRAEVFLPEMRDAIVEMLRPAAGAILAIAEVERDAYLAYWSSQVGDARVLLSDIGYAGTIQTHLATLTGRSLAGAYFALTSRATQTGLHGGKAWARYHDQRLHGVQASTILAHDLLLESVLTAPTAQFSHFEQDGPRLNACYAADQMQRPGFSTVNTLHEGVMAFISNVCDVVGEDALEMEFDPLLVQKPLHCYGSGLWKGGNWSRDLTVDDQFTGRGNVATR